MKRQHIFGKTKTKQGFGLYLKLGPYGREPLCPCNSLLSIIDLFHLAWKHCFSKVVSLKIIQFFRPTLYMYCFTKKVLSLDTNDKHIFSCSTKTDLNSFFSPFSHLYSIVLSSSLIYIFQHRLTTKD